MELVLAAHHLNLPVGAATYLLTVAGHLERLGHGVTVFTRDAGPLAERARESGLRVALGEDLPDRCDAAITQDAGCAYSLAERYPEAPQVFVAHSVRFDFELPPQLPGTVGAVVAMNDHIARRVRAGGLEQRVVRLRQPVDMERFRPPLAPRSRARRAVLLGNNLRDARREMLTAALASAGIEWSQLGTTGEGGVELDPSAVLRDADIVVGYGRAVLEGMACGAAAYVYDTALDGWVTPESYAAIEADGFAGRATGASATPERLAEDLAAWTPELGVAGRELCFAHHSPYTHSTALAGLLTGLGRREPPADPVVAELSRMARVQWATHLRALHHAEEALEAHRRARELEEALAAAQALGEAQAHDARTELAALKATRRYRLAGALARPLDRGRDAVGRDRGRRPADG